MYQLNFPGEGASLYKITPLSIYILNINIITISGRPATNLEIYVDTQEAI